MSKWRELNNSNATGYISAVAAAVAYGINNIIIKKGVSDFASPLVGATIAFFFGMAFLLLASLGNFGPSVKNNRKGALFLALAGMSAGLGVSANYSALSLAPVVVVAPITSINPLITLILAYVVLRKLERITLRVIMGAILVVLGVILITLGRNLL